MKQSLDPESNSTLQVFAEAINISVDVGIIQEFIEKGVQRSFGASEGSAANNDRYNPLVDEKEGVEALAALILTSVLVLIEFWQPRSSTPSELPSIFSILKWKQPCLK